MARWTVIEYRRLDKAVEDEIEKIDHDSIEYHDYTHISKKIKEAIAKEEQKEIKDENEFDKKKNKNHWECTICNTITRIEMVKKCTKCGMSGENIRLSFLEDLPEIEEN